MQACHPPVQATCPGAEGSWRDGTSTASCRESSLTAPEWRDRLPAPSAAPQSLWPTLNTFVTCTVHPVVRGQTGDSLRGPLASLPAGPQTAPAPGSPTNAVPEPCQPQRPDGLLAAAVTSLPGSPAPQAEDRTPHRCSRPPRVPSPAAQVALSGPPGAPAPSPASRARPALPVLSASPGTFRTAAAGPALGPSHCRAWCCSFGGPSRPPSQARSFCPLRPSPEATLRPRSRLPRVESRPSPASRGAVRLSPLVCERGSPLTSVDRLTKLSG